ncbi:hypothetical protein BABINDRAFT_169588, partial [Babjeviella inositovora NRRL Y-12698]
LDQLTFYVLFEASLMPLFLLCFKSPLSGSILLAGVVLKLAIFAILRIVGGIMLAIAHGLVSPALFICVGGTPLSANFIGELLSFIGALNKNVLVGALAVSSVLLSACYQMRLTNRLTGGSKSPYLHVTSDLTKRESLLLCSLLLPTLYMGVRPDFVIELLDTSVSSLLLHL